MEKTICAAPGSPICASSSGCPSAPWPTSCSFWDWTWIKNAIQRIESGQRFVTDIELCVFCRFFHIRADVLLGLEEWVEKI